MNELFKLKKLLGIDNDSNDIILEFILEDVKQRIKNYCHIEEIPKELETTVIRMAMEIYKNETFGTTEDGSFTKSISEGDTSVTFEKQEFESGHSESILKNYIPILSRFRKLMW